MKKRTTFKEDLAAFGKVKVLTLTAMLIAMSVVIGILCKNWLTWNIYYRFTLENLPIFFAAIAFGPFVGAAAGVLADLVSCLCSTNPAVNPIISLWAPWPWASWPASCPTTSASKATRRASSAPWPWGT